MEGWYESLWGTRTVSKTNSGVFSKQWYRACSDLLMY